MTEIFSRRPRGARSIRTLATLAAAATVGAMLPALGTAAASAATPSCAVPTHLTSFDAIRAGATELKDPVLTWSPAAGATGYEVQISPNEDFTNNVFIDTTTIATRYTPPTLTLTHGDYFWRVRATAATCWSDDSGSAAEFSRGWADCPTQLTPVRTTARPTDCDSGNLVSDSSSAAQIAAATGYLNPDDERFTWAPIPDASFYELEVSSNPDFPEQSNTQGAGSGTQGSTNGLVALTCFTANTTVTPGSQVFTQFTEPERLPSNLTSCFSQGDINTDQTYYWRVRGLDGSGGAVKGKPYDQFLIGVSHSPPADAPPAATSSPVTVTKVTDNVYEGPGQTIRIDGTGFTAAATVTVGSTAVAPGQITYVSSTELLAAVPAPGTQTGEVDVTVGVGAYSSSSTAADKFNYGTGGSGIDLTGFEAGSWTPTVPFCVKATDASTTCSGNPVAATPTAPTGNLAGIPDADGILKACQASVGAGASCASTPTLGWAPISGASEYRVYIASDAALSNIVRVYETHDVTLTPRDDILDSQAGKTWYVAVQGCDNNGCYTVNPTFGFAKRSEPIHSTSSSTSAQGVVVLNSTDGAATVPLTAAPSSASQVTYTWGDYTCSSPGGADQALVTPLNDCRSTNPTEASPLSYRTVVAQEYHIQVSTDCDFTNIVDEATVDSPEYTSATKSLGDGSYYVRVQAIDESGTPLTYGGGNNRTTADCGAPAFTIDRTPPAASLSVSPTDAVSVSWSDAGGVATPGTAQLIDTTSGLPANASVVPSGSVLTVTPAPFLIPGHSYGVAVSGATDIAGNVTPATVLPAFTAAAAPTAVTTGDGASLKLTYSAPVLGLTADKVHLIADAGNVQIPASVVIVNSTTAEVTAVTTLVSNAAYSLSVDSGVTDVTGLLQAITGNVPGSIKSPFPPGINSAHPKEGVYTATVDQAVSGFTADKVHLYTDSTNVDVPASVVVVGSTATVTAVVRLIPGESYGLRVDGGIVGLDHVAVPSGPIPGTFREATKEDSDLLTRNGHWGDRVARGSDNGSALVSGTGNPSLTGRFRSSVLTAAYCVGPMDGYLSISIDGKLVKTVNTLNAFTACGKKLTFRGLSGAVQHTVTFKKTGRKGSAKGGSQVVIDYINAG